MSTEDTQAGLMESMFHMKKAINPCDGNQDQDTMKCMRTDQILIMLRDQLHTLLESGWVKFASAFTAASTRLIESL